tara:strand:+ start:873 stop:1409 length:537 start_codon:yes stop_codon:yes gene_type:complete
MSSAIEKVEKWVKKVIKPEHRLKHHLRARDFLLIIEPKASIETQISALTHDIERVFPGRIPAIKNFKNYNEDYLLKHGARSAEHVIEFLKKNKINVDFEKIKEMITNHDIGGSEECNLVKDADSLSFLEVLPKHCIRHYEDKDFSRIKFKFMFDRIDSKKAKKLAKPLYEKAMELIES